MGSTESKNKPNLEKEYRLVRRFISDLYGSSQVTVIEHKQTKEHFILKEYVQQFNSEKVMKELDSHRSLYHRNLIHLRRFWKENDLNICSTLFKIYAIFDYHEATLQEFLVEPQQLKDREIADFVRQVSSALTYLERNKIYYLLSGPRSIAVLEESDKERNRNSNELVSHRSASKLQEDPFSHHRKSTTQFHQNECRHSRQYSQLRVSFNADTSLLEQKTSRKTYKIFDPIQGLSAWRSSHNVDKYLQVPMHPSLATNSDFSLLSDSMVKQQNSLTIGLIALSMTEGCDIVDLDLYKYGRFSYDRYIMKINSLKQSHPKTSKQLEKTTGHALINFQQSFRISQGVKGRQKSVDLRMNPKSESKENLGLNEGIQEDRKEKSLIKMLSRTSTKRISLCQI